MRKDLQLVIADIDGTIVNTPRQMMPITRKALQCIHEQGVLFGIASGRPLGPHLMELASDWQLGFPFDVMIGMNGGQLHDMQDDVFEDFYPLQPSTIQEILEMMEPIEANPFIYIGEDMLSKYIDEDMIASMNRHHIQCRPVEHIEQLYAQPTNKILFRLKRAEDMPYVEQYAKQHGKPEYTSFKTQPTMLEFQDSRISKGVALQRYVSKKNLDMEKVMAFGDMSNDLEMIQIAGLGVCMKNGSSDMKAAARYITEYTNDEDGLGRFLFDHVL